MKLVNLLTELFDSTPYPHRLINKMMVSKNPPRWRYHYQFTSPKSGITYQVLISKMEIRNVVTCDIEYKPVGGKMADMTDANEVGPIITTIAKIVKEFHPQYGTEVDKYIIIGNNRPDENPNRETARTRVFLSAAKKLLPSGWRITQVGSGIVLTP